MRDTTFVGHTTAVETFLRHCVKGKKIGVVTGMCDEPLYDLHEYGDPTGDVWEEFLQYSPWRSGPYIFLGIRQVMGWKDLNENLDAFGTPVPFTVDKDKGEFSV